MKQIHGWSFPDADEFMMQELSPEGHYQAGHLKIALEHVTNWSLAIDGGAHVGTWSRMLSAVFAKVIAVEPSPDTFEALTTNMRRFECQNVEAKHLALGARRGTVRMVLEGRALALANTGGRYVSPGGQIPCEAIDDWKLPSLGFLKLDVEGSEPAILEGAALTLRRCQPIVLFENKGLCRKFGFAKDASQTLLTSFGYRHAATAGCDEIWKVAA